MRAATLIAITLLISCRPQNAAVTDRTSDTLGFADMTPRDSTDTSLSKPRVITGPTVVVFWLAGADTLSADDQAEALDQELASRGIELDAVLELEVDEGELLDRIRGRAEAAANKGERIRSDDNPDVFKSRLDVYRAQTVPVTEYYRSQGLLNTVDGLRSIDAVTEDLAAALAKIPAEAVGNTRNDMYLASEALRFLMKDKESDLSAGDVATLNAYKGSLDNATKFIPTWVKVAVAIALGLGTMIGWKRIVVTVGEKIGKTHLTYAQGASAELVAAATIGAADMFGLPVSTTHVLSSGVAGAMAANGSGLQIATIRNMVMAWILTLPAAIMLSGGLYVLFSQVF